MKKILIDGIEYPIKANGLTMLIYREEFKKDFISFVVGHLQEIDNNLIELAEIEYAMIKSCNDTIGSFQEWLSGIEHIGDIVAPNNFQSVLSELNDSMATTYKEENNNQSNRNKKVKKTN